MKRAFGNTGLTVSAIGLGAGPLGDAALAEADVGSLLHGAVDRGVTLIDTARGYGLSEERIGRHLGARRHELVLSTKVGYGIPGVPDWTGRCILAGVDAALARLRTDVIDLVFLHSCPLDVLERGEVIEALHQAQRAGKLRVPGYSGDNAELAWAVRSGAFGAIETSVNLVDGWSLANVLPEAQRRGLGVIAKRPLANAPWRYRERPTRDDLRVYWDRFQALGVDPRGLSWPALALRFVAAQPLVHSALVGTTRLAHLEEDLALFADGPLEAEVEGAIRVALAQHAWPGLI